MGPKIDHQRRKTKTRSSAGLILRDQFHQLRYLTAVDLLGQDGEWVCFDGKFASENSSEHKRHSDQNLKMNPVHSRGLVSHNNSLESDFLL